MTDDNETPQAWRARMKLQAITRALGEWLDRKAGLKEKGVGFTLLLWDVGEKGAITYCSNGNRADMMKAMRELLGKLEIEAGAQLIERGKRRD